MPGLSWSILQRWLVSFYPKRLDLAKELEELAGSLGGRLTSSAIVLEVRMDAQNAWLGRGTAGPDLALTD
jgi:hypothetical protein